MNMQKGEGGQRDPVVNMIVWGGEGMELPLSTNHICVLHWLCRIIKRQAEVLLWATQWKYNHLEILHLHQMCRIQALLL